MPEGDIMNINNVTSSTLLDMLSDTSTSKSDDIFTTLIQNNNLRCQKRLEELGITSSSSSSDESYKKVSASATNVSEAINKLTDSSLWNDESKDYSRDNIDNAVKGFVSTYNTFLSNISKVGNSIEGTFKTALNTITDEYKDKLSAVGITVGDDGRLTIDEDKFKAADVSKLKELFGKDSKMLEGINTYSVDCAGIVSKALSMQNSMSGLYNSSSNTIDVNSYLSGSAFDSIG